MSWVMIMTAAPVRLAQVAHQAEDLSLDGDIERGGRLVGDQDRGVARQRHGDHDPLAHAARHLVGVLVEPLLGIGNADQFEHLERPGLGGVLVRGPGAT